MFTRQGKTVRDEQNANLNLTIGGVVDHRNFYEFNMDENKNAYLDGKISFDLMMERRDEMFIENLKKNTLVGICLHQPKLIPFTFKIMSGLLLISFLAAFIISSKYYKYGEYRLKGNDPAIYSVYYKWWGIEKVETKYFWRKAKDTDMMDWCIEGGDGYYSAFHLLD